MGRTQIKTRDVQDETLTGDDIKDGSIMESELDPALFNDLKYTRYEFVDEVVPMGYSLTVGNELIVHGELRILGRVKIC